MVLIQLKRKSLIWDLFCRQCRQDMGWMCKGEGKRRIKAPAGLWLLPLVNEDILYWVLEGLTEGLVSEDGSEWNEKSDFDHIKFEIPVKNTSGAGIYFLFLLCLEQLSCNIICILNKFRMTFKYSIEVIFHLASSIISCFHYLVFEITNITNCLSRKV